MMIHRLHHAQITIPSGQEDAARDFYCGVLGLEEMDKPESLRHLGGLWLRLGDQQVHLGTEDGVERTRTKAHLAYEVDDLAGWRARIEAQGIAVLDAIPIPGCDRFEFRDPFGNRVELIQVLDEDAPTPPDAGARATATAGSRRQLRP